MDSVKNLPGGAAPAVAPKARPAGRSQTTYESESLREVQARASHIRHGETAPERSGIRRLDTILATGKELRRDVPRGFYLNITV